MDELVTWLRGVLDEIAGVAVAASRSDQTSWSAGNAARIHPDPTEYRTVTVDFATETVCGSILSEKAEHIARHDPRSVLARVEAERAMVDRMAVLSASWAGYEEESWQDEVRDMLRWLAYGHRFDAPGYDPAWAPQGAEGDRQVHQVVPSR